MSRHDQIIERTRQNLIDDGYKETEIYEKNKEGMGDYESFFELMVDRKLDGQKEPTAQEVWESMKAQLNYAEKEIRDANKEYTKLFNKHFDLQQLHDDLLKGR